MVIKRGEYHGTVWEFVSSSACLCFPVCERKNRRKTLCGLSAIVSGDLIHGP